MTGAPVRTCVGCRRRRVQAELLRMRRDDRHHLVLDRHGPGRGAWLCADTAVVCLDTAIARKALPRALRTRLDPSSIDGFRQALIDRP